jgi:hypothetical protein
MHVPFFQPPMLAAQVAFAQNPVLKDTGLVSDAVRAAVQGYPGHEYGSQNAQLNSAVAGGLAAVQGVVAMNAQGQGRIVGRRRRRDGKNSHNFHLE